MAYSRRTSPATAKGPNRRLKKTLLISGAILLAAAVTVVILEVTNTTYWFHKRLFVPTLTANANTKGAGAPATTPQSSSTTSTKTQPGDTGSTSTTGQPSTGTASGTATVQTPSGVFVSSHHVTLSSTIQSVCNTNPGASCTITFTKDGTTKSLAAQGTDAGGSTYWQWQPKTIGLTAGNWTITAQATLNGQSQTASDALQLEVTP